MIKLDKFFQPVDVMSMEKKFFNLLANEWMLITIGEPNSFNTMTASWGSFGFLWNMPIATIFIRPQRHTFFFSERYAPFTLSFFKEEYRDVLKFCGSKSGRDYNKMKETGLTSVLTPNQGIAFKEAYLVFDCQKVYEDKIHPQAFIDKSINDSVYKLNDHHKFYIGSIKGCYTVDEGCI